MELMKRVKVLDTHRNKSQICQKLLSPTYSLGCKTERILAGYSNWMKEHASWWAILPEGWKGCMWPDVEVTVIYCLSGTPLGAIFDHLYCTGRASGSVTYKYKISRQGLLNLYETLQPLCCTHYASSIWGSRNQTKISWNSKLCATGIFGCSQIFLSVVCLDSGRRFWMGEGYKQVTFKYVVLLEQMGKNAFLIDCSMGYLYGNIWIERITGVLNWRIF